MDEYYFPVEPEIIDNYGGKYRRLSSILVRGASWLLPFGLGIIIGINNYGNYVLYGNPGPLILVKFLYNVSCLVGITAVLVRLLGWGYQYTYEPYRTIPVKERLDIGLLILAVFVAVCAILCFLSGVYLIAIGEGIQP